MTPMEKAWLVLKAEFHFEPNLREITKPPGWVPLSVPNRPNWGTAEWESEIENRPAESNINLGHYKWSDEVRSMSDGEFKPPEYAYSDGAPNSYWKHYDKKYDNAFRERRAGNLAPYHQFKVVHETMANFQPPDYQGDKENVKTYPWLDHDLWQEAQKVRQGGWE